jgi:xanthine dehydrogenase YagR molybdenum-binding subunit
VEHGPVEPAVRLWARLVRIDLQSCFVVKRMTNLFGSLSVTGAQQARVPEPAWSWGPAGISCGRWLSKNLTGISPPVNADMSTGIQVHFVDEFDAHASPTGARGIGELGATGVAAAAANAVYDAVRIRIRDLPITPARLLSA